MESQVFEPTPYVPDLFPVTLTNPGPGPLRVRYGDGYNLQEVTLAAGETLDVQADGKWKVEILPAVQAADYKGNTQAPA